jgi:hypothetical protein
MKNPGERELFGTLLASTPQKVRSWKSLALAVVIHAVLITAAVVTFEPFQPRPDEEQVVPLNIVIVEEDAVTPLPNPFARPAAPPAVAAAPRTEKKEEQLVLRPGPLAPITDVQGPPSEPTTDAVNAVEGPATSGRSGGTLADRLRPAYVDPRITTTTAFPPAEKTGAEALRERILGQISVYNDSIAEDAAIRRRDSDWTLKGKNGERWGVSEEGLHLGKITIPAKAIAFTPPPGRREEIAARVRDFHEIERQVMLEESRASFKDRVESIRARKDRERAERKKKDAEKAKPITDLN